MQSAAKKHQKFGKTAIWVESKEYPKYRESKRAGEWFIDKERVHKGSWIKV